MQKAPDAKPDGKPEIKPDGKQGAVNGPATVLVKGAGDVRLIVDGQPQRFTAPEQRFVTPELQAGRTYAYDFTATLMRDGKEVTLTRKVLVRAGQETRVDLDEASVAQDTGGKATVTVKLPADARLYVEGVLTTQTGAVRTFETPRLESGKPYVYDLRAEVVRDGQVRRISERVTVEANKAVEVELKLAEAAVAAR
jgi:uncharacterized protein (TIGR03000 family)